MHRAKRAIIMAAGIGVRMQPLTYETPKPLIVVDGKRMIDTVIDALYQNGIYEVYVVVGYLKEKFSVLKDKYPEIRLIENPFYEQCNNISSLYAAREYIPESIILDGDQIIYNNNILKPEFERSGYCCMWTDKKTKEWLLCVKEGVVVSCSRNGGTSGWQLYSVSFWSKEDGERLRKHLTLEFEIKKNRNIYWDDVAMFCYPEEYKLGIRKIEDGDLVEVDSILELSSLDGRYGYLLKEREDKNDSK